MRPVRAVADVSRLPRTVFGHRAPMWWGTIGFIIIEGSTLVICAVSYFYLRRNFSSWPPEHVDRPDLLLPSMQAALMLVSIIPMRWVERDSRRMDVHGVRSGLLICSVLILVITVLRAFEFGALNVRWDSNAYGSVVWATLTLHGTLVLLEAAETLAITVLMFRDRVEERDLSGVSDNALYWYFLTFSWLPLYLLIFLAPNLV
jgi:cytochrome c oxidase subunit III